METKGSTLVRSSKRRKDILQAALECFVELGFSNTTMEEIRKRSGASTGSIYHHFKSKEQLATSIYLAGIADYQAGFVRELDGSRDARAGIAAVIRYHLRWVQEHPEWARYLFQMRYTDFMAAAEYTIAEQNREFYGHIQRWLDDRHKKGELKRLPFEITLQIIISPCFGFARLWLNGKVKTDPGKAGRIFADAAWRALR